jgi:hypothetical protein
VHGYPETADFQRNHVTHGIFQERKRKGLEEWPADNLTR